MIAEMSCEDYSILVIALPDRAELPKAVRDRMNQHLENCNYHRGRTFTQSAVGTPVTEDMEKAALEVVKVYS